MTSVFMSSGVADKADSSIEKPAAHITLIMLICCWSVLGGPLFPFLPFSNYFSCLMLHMEFSSRGQHIPPAGALTGNILPFFCVDVKAPQGGFQCVLES